MKEPLTLVMFPYSTGFQNRRFGILCWVGAHGPKSKKPIQACLESPQRWNVEQIEECDP
jgi:hypothetical protein